MARRVAVTGLGLITSIGNSKAEVLASLRENRTGIAPLAELAERGAPVSLAGAVKGFDTAEERQEDWMLPEGYAIPRELLRSMSPNAAYGYCAMGQAIVDAGLEAGEVSGPQTGLLAASGGSMRYTYSYLRTMSERGIHRVHPLGMPAAIAGTLNMNLVAGYKIKGVSLGISTACASSAHGCGYGFDLIRHGRQDIVFVVGAEDCDYWSIVPFAGLRAITPSKDPGVRPSPFDVGRDGFCVAGGAAVLVLEEMGRAEARGARVYAEMLGWGEASDGYSVVAPEPDGDGIGRAMEQCLRSSGLERREVSYINAHATGTPVGDVAELRAIQRVFGRGGGPAVGSTKALTGHGLSLAGALEAALSVLAIREGFIPATTNLREPDPAAEGTDLVRDVRWEAPRVVVSNSSGFGGSNVALAFGR